LSSYLQVELDALNIAPQLGAACGISPAIAWYGLNNLWARCFRESTDQINNLMLRGFFEGVDVGETLEAFGFLEKSETGWRVRGADKYLRVKEAQKAGRIKGGLAAKSNLIPGARQKKSAQKTLSAEPKNHSADSGLPLGLVSADLSAVLGSLHQSPNTIHQSPNTSLKEKTVGKAEKPPSDPRLKPLTEKLADVYENSRGAKYKHGGAKDALALKSLLPLGTDDEILALWRFGLSLTKWPGVSNLSELASKWNALKGAASPQNSNLPEMKVIR
jgi:hypothetical protein